MKQKMMNERVSPQEFIHRLNEFAEEAGEPIFMKLSDVPDTPPRQWMRISPDSAASVNVKRGKIGSFGIDYMDDLEPAPEELREQISEFFDDRVERISVLSSDGED